LFIKNYPNPFNSNTRIKISIPEKSYITLDVYDINGRFVQQLAKGNYNSGNYEYNFNGSNMASGIYFIVLRTDSKIKVNKIVLQK
jgi:myo-inositol-hexaphosphate 3-phosphohydrolase